MQRGGGYEESYTRTHARALTQLEEEKGSGENEEESSEFGGRNSGAVVQEWIVEGWYEVVGDSALCIL